MNVDPLLVRGIFVALAVIGGLGLLLYGVAWLLMPQQDGRIHAQEALRGHITAGFVGAVICILLDLGRGAGPAGGGSSGSSTVHYSVGGLLTLVVVGLAVWWWATHQGPGSGPGAGGAGGGGPGGTTTPGAHRPTAPGAGRRRIRRPAGRDRSPGVRRRPP